MRDWLEQDARVALRVLSRHPGFSLIAVAVLALGMGASTALFSAIDRVLIRALPFNAPDRLVEIHETAGKANWRNAVSYPNFRDWRERSTSFESLSFAGVYFRTLRRGGAPAERLPAAYVSGDFFRTYRVQAAAGRVFADSDDRVDAPPVTVLTRKTWLNRFGGDPTIVGKTIQLDHQAVTVIGILPDFPYYREADLYMPLAHGVRAFMLDRRENHNNSAVTGRLRPGISISQAQAELSQIAASLAAEYPGSNHGVGVKVEPLHEVVAGGSRRTLLLLGSAVMGLLLLACVNVANLLLVRAATRAREISVRAALGANPFRVVRQLMTESLLLALAGAAAGIFVARAGVVLLTRLVPGSLAAGLGDPDWRIFLFTAVLAVLSSILFGAAPAWHAARLDVQHTLRQYGRGSAAGAPARIRNALVVAQVALAVVLVTGAGLFLRSLQRLLGEDPGLRTRGVIALSLTIPGAETQMARVPGRFVRAEESVRALPGVSSAGLVSAMPLTGANSNANIQPEGYQPPAPNQWPAADFRAVTPGYFSTVGLPLMQGRLFDQRDGVMPPLSLDELLPWFQSTSFVCVVNQAMALHFWPGQNPIGKRFRFGPPSLEGPWVQVVGVVGNTRQKGLHQAPEPLFYLSAYKHPWPEQTLLVRASGQPASISKSLREAIAQADPDMVVGQPRTLDDVVAGSTTARRDGLILMGVFAAFALVLAATGVYGVVAFVAATRGPEFGIRVALGAARADVVGLVLRQGLWLVVSGLLLGTGLCLALGRGIAGMLYGISATDPLVYAGSAAVLLAAGLAAIAIPAFRATQVDPVTVLRSE